MRSKRDAIKCLYDFGKWTVKISLWRNVLDLTIRKVIRCYERLSRTPDHPHSGHLALQLMLIKSSREIPTICWGRLAKSFAWISEEDHQEQPLTQDLQTAKCKTIGCTQLEAEWHQRILLAEWNCSWSSSPSTIKMTGAGHEKFHKRGSLIIPFDHRNWE